MRVRHRVAVLTGCIQDIAFSDVNRATVDVLLENGCEVATPRDQSCCGSLHVHNGDLESAKTLARRQIDAIDPASFDAIISNSAGCGSHLKRYHHLLADDPAYAEKAKAWSAKVKDISEWLVEIGFRRPNPPAAGCCRSQSPIMMPAISATGRRSPPSPGRSCGRFPGWSSGNARNPPCAAGAQASTRSPIRRLPHGSGTGRWAT